MSPLCLNECLLKKGKSGAKQLTTYRFCKMQAAKKTIKMILWNTPQSNIKRDNRQLRWKWSGGEREIKKKKNVLFATKTVDRHMHLAFIAILFNWIANPRGDNIFSKKNLKLPIILFKFRIRTFFHSISKFPYLVSFIHF